jgi:hypothetical protein
VVTGVWDLHDHDARLAQGPGKRSAVLSKQMTEKLKGLGDKASLTTARVELTSNDMPAPMKPTDNQVRSALQVFFFFFFYVNLFYYF